MKSLLYLLLAFVLAASGCGHSAREKLVSKIKDGAKQAAMRHLDCRTGDPVAEDVGEQVSRLLKVQKVGAKSGDKGIGESVCKALVKVAVPYVVDLGNQKLPVSWAEDGCSLKNAGEHAGEFADKLCERIPL